MIFFLNLTNSSGPKRDTVELGVMEKQVYAILPRSLELESHQQIQFSIVHKKW